MVGRAGFWGGRGGGEGGAARRLHAVGRGDLLGQTPWRPRQARPARECLPLRSRSVAACHGRSGPRPGRGRAIEIGAALRPQGSERCAWMAACYSSRRHRVAACPGAGHWIWPAASARSVWTRARLFAPYPPKAAGRICLAGPAADNTRRCPGPRACAPAARRLPGA